MTSMTTKSVLATALLAAPPAEGFTASLSYRDTAPKGMVSSASRGVPSIELGAPNVLMRPDKRDGVRAVTLRQPRSTEEETIVMHFGPCTDMFTPGEMNHSDFHREFSESEVSRNYLPGQSVAELAHVPIEAAMRSTDTQARTPIDARKDQFLLHGTINGVSCDHQECSLETARLRRAAKKREVRDSRRVHADRIRGNTVGPMVDLVGMTVPIALIIGMSMAQTFPS